MRRSLEEMHFAAFAWHCQRLITNNIQSNKSEVQSLSFEILEPVVYNGTACVCIRSDSDLIKFVLCARLASMHTRNVQSRLGSSPGHPSELEGSSKSINQLKGNRKILFWNNWNLSRFKWALFFVFASWVRFFSSYSILQKGHFRRLFGERCPLWSALETDCQRLATIWIPLVSNDRSLHQCSTF